MVLIRVRVLGVLVAGLLALAACETSGDVGFSEAGQPRLANWTCTGGVSLTVQRSSGGLAVSDSRGVAVELPPDPPGQRERYASTGYALVFAGRTASWFAAGQAPTDCRR